MDFLKLGEEIFRDFATDGVPASGAHNPVKEDIRAWMEVVEGVVGFAKHATDDFGLVAPRSVYIQLDSDNDDTTRVFQVRKDSATPGGGTLLLEVAESGQVAIGSAAVAANRKFFVQQIDTDDNASNGHAAIECRQDYQPAGNSSANPDGIYGTLWYNSPHTFTGSGAAVRGNAYTIAQSGGANVNVTNLIGVYGRGRHEAAGTVTNAISFFADGAQNAGGGTITNAMALWIDTLTAATNNYGVFFENAPNAGSIAAAQDIDITTKVTGTGVIAWHTAGAEKARLTATGNLKIGGTANRGTTEGTNQLVLFNGTAPAGTLANGASFYAASGEMRVMDAAGNNTLLSPHDRVTNEWIYHSIDTRTGKGLRIDIERMLRALNERFGYDFVHEFTADAA